MNPFFWSCISCILFIIIFKISGPGSTPFTQCLEMETTDAYIQCNFTDLNPSPHPEGSPLLISVEGNNCGDSCSDTQPVGLVISDPQIALVSADVLPGYGVQDRVIVIQGSGFLLDEVSADSSAVTIRVSVPPSPKIKEQIRGCSPLSISRVFIKCRLDGDPFIVNDRDGVLLYASVTRLSVSRYR
jgi:hypothetical protein